VRKVSGPVQAAHEPAQVGEARAPAANASRRPVGREVLAWVVGAAKQPTVASDDFVVAPIASGFALDADHEVEVVAQDGVGADADGEIRGERGEQFNDPVLAVVEIASRGVVLAAEEGAAHAAADTCLPYEATGEVGW